MRKVGWILLVVLLVIALLAVLSVLFWPWVSHRLPHESLLKAWADYLVLDLRLAQWGPLVLLLLIGVLELIWALVLGRRSNLFERQLKRLDRQYAKEVDVLKGKVTLLKDERRLLRAELDLREDLIREEKMRLWARFDDLQRASGLAEGRLVILDASEPSPDVRGEWRQVIAQLERIDSAFSSVTRNNETELQRKQRSSECLRLGMACYYLGQYERALTHFQRSFDLKTSDPIALLDHGVVNIALGRHQAALRDLDQFLGLEEDPWAYLYRALARERLGDERGALDDYAQAIRMDPDFVLAYHRRGLLYAKGWEHEKALQDQNRALELDQGLANAYTARGVAKTALGDGRGALGDLDMGCILAPDQHQSFLERGRTKYQLEMYDDSLMDLQRAAELAPANEAVFLARGECLFALGEHSRAIADYDRVIEMQPRDAEAYCARGGVRAAAGDYQQAIEDYDLALQIDPTLAVALAERGAANEKLGEYKLAIADLDRAIALDPDLAVAYYNRSLAYGSQGEYDRASRDLNKAAELEPSFRTGQVGGQDSSTV